MNDISNIDQLTSKVKGQDIFDILENDFSLLYMTRKIINGLPPITYSFYSELDAISREMLTVYFLENPIWQRISMFSNKWTDFEAYSSSLVTIS